MHRKRVDTIHIHHIPHLVRGLCRAEGYLRRRRQRLACIGHGREFHNKTVLSFVRFDLDYFSGAVLHSCWGNRRFRLGFRVRVVIGWIDGIEGTTSAPMAWGVIVEFRTTRRGRTSRFAMVGDRWR